MFRLSLHFGEWIFDPTRGRPYELWQSLKPVPDLLMKQDIRSTLGDVPGVTSVQDVNITRDDAARQVDISVSLLIGREVVELAYDDERTQRFGNVSIYVRSRSIVA